MKVLTAVPPMIPSYFNAGHHLPIFQVAEYLRRRTDIKVVAKDFCALNATWKDVADTLARGKFDAILLLNDFDGIDTFERFISYTRKLSPSTRIATFGRLSKQVPSFFKRFDIDAIHYSGDFEIGVDALLTTAGADQPVGGFLIRDNQNWLDTGIGEFLAPEDWGMPSVTEIPYQDYLRMYADDSNRFCGVPERLELVVNVARGCPIGCSFCEIPTQQGRSERRMTVASTLSYIREAMSLIPFEYVSFYAPTFTLNKRWVREFCNEIIASKDIFRWKCVTTIHHLDEELISLMSQAGCIRISVGVETLAKDEASEAVPLIKAKGFTEVSQVAEAMKRGGIEFNAFVILGLPGTNIDDAKETIEAIEEMDGRVRPTIHTSYEQITEEMSLSDVCQFNRQLFSDHDRPVDEHLYYDIFFGRHFKPTEVATCIPQRQGDKN